MLAKEIYEFVVFKQLGALVLRISRRGRMLFVAVACSPPPLIVPLPLLVPVPLPVLVPLPVPLLVPVQRTSWAQFATSFYLAHLLPLSFAIDSTATQFEAISVRFMKTTTNLIDFNCDSTLIQRLRKWMETRTFTFLNISEWFEKSLSYSLQFCCFSFNLFTLHWFGHHMWTVMQWVFAQRCCCPHRDKQRFDREWFQKTTLSCAVDVVLEQ